VSFKGRRMSTGRKPAKMSLPQRFALLWVAGEDVPDTYDSPHLNTLKALARQGLVEWSSSDLASSRSYWTTPEGSYLDHWFPALTAKGTALVREWVPVEE
jgi:hypothetical protein